MAVLGGHLNDDESPFCDHALTDYAGSAARKRLTKEVQAVLEQLDKIAGYTSKAYAGVGSDSIKAVAFTAEVSRRASVPTYYFAGDDESLDFGCLTPDKITSFGFRCGPMAVEYRGGRTSLVVTEVDQDVDWTVPLLPSQESLDKCRRLKGVSVRKPCKRDAFMGDFYGFACRHWPAAAGDPAKMLGIGTWELFKNLHRDYEVIGDRRAKKGPLIEQDAPARASSSRRAATVRKSGQKAGKKSTGVKKSGAKTEPTKPKKAFSAAATNTAVTVDRSWSFAGERIDTNRRSQSI